MPYTAPRISNVDIYNKVRAGLSKDFQDRLPPATVANMKEIGTAISSTYFKPQMNEWQSALFNKIGMTIFHDYSLDNPLGKYIYGRMDFGDAIEEIGLGLVKGTEVPYGKDGESVDPFIISSNEVKAMYHRINNPIQYMTTVKRDLLNRAFRREYGLSRLIGMFVNALYNSANVDSWLLTKSIMAYYINDYMATQGYPLLPDQKIGVNPLTDLASIQDFILAVKDAINDMSFPQARFNPMEIPKRLRNRDFVLFINGRAMNRISVKALSAAFNPKELGFNVTLEPMDNFGTDPAGGTTDDVLAVLAERNWLLITEQFEDLDMARNPRGRYFNYFLTRGMSFGCTYFADVAIFSTRYPVSERTLPLEAGYVPQVTQQ